MKIRLINILAVIIIILLVCIIIKDLNKAYYRENYSNIDGSLPPPPTQENSDIEFNLYNLKDKLIKNKNWEYEEQYLLGKYLKPTDNVLQLGGNIGASCIYADKIIKKDNKNICVEPNDKIMKTLEKNKNYNNCHFDIVHGVISDENDLKLNDTNELMDNNYWSSHISDKGDKPVKSYPLMKLNGADKINVLFADCEGCLEKFVDEYEIFLNQLRLIIYEIDAGSPCNYQKIENIFRKHNFVNVENLSRGNLPGCKVWLRK